MWRRSLWTKGITKDGIAEGALRRHAKELTTFDLYQDLRLDPLVSRREALEYPGFLLMNPLGNDLGRLVTRCHGRDALIINPKLGWDRKGSEPERCTATLLNLMDRSLLLCRPGEGVGEFGGAHVILSMSPTEDLPPSGEALLDRLLWLTTTEIKSDAKGDGGRRFLEAFAKAAEEILQIRRVGSIPYVDIEDSKVCAALDKADRGHLQSFGAEPERALPLSLAWSIGFLGRHLGQASLLSIEAIAEISRISARLAKTHLEAMATFRGTREHNSLINRARRIVDLVEEAGSPLDLRDITRHFSEQQQSLFLPVLDVLVHHKVLVKHGDRE